MGPAQISEKCVIGKILNAVSLIIKGHGIPRKCSMDVSMNELVDKWVDGWTDGLMDAGNTYHTYSKYFTFISWFDSKIILVDKYY